MTLLLLRWLVYNSDVDIRGSPRSKRKGFFFFPFFPERWRINKVFAGEFLIHMLFGGCSAPSFPFHRVSPFIRQSSYILRRRLLKGFFFFFQQSPTLSTAQHQLDRLIFPCSLFFFLLLFVCLCISHFPDAYHFFFNSLDLIHYI